MKNIFTFLFFVVMLFSCKQDKVEPDCIENLFFYTIEEQPSIPLTQFKKAIWIEFSDNAINLEQARQIISKYDNLIIWESFRTNGDFSKVWVNISGDFDCKILNQYLKKLNSDSDIIYATPIFGEPGNKYYTIITNEIITKPKEGIQKKYFESMIHGFGLEIVKFSEYYYLLKVKDIKTGYEPVLLANKIFESHKSEWSQPNFIIPIFFGKSIL